ncbi:MAG: UbiH/UbiF/VisC/COQ6 family ubiquinone biosynthesis hydroxylase [Sulfurifustis sp.]
MKHAPPSPAYDVVVVGGGIVGAAFACALGDSALKVALIERTPPVTAMSADYELRVSALTLASRTLFEALGVWDGIAQRRVAGVCAMQVWDAEGRGEIRFDAAEIGEPYLAYIVENNVIAAALHERMQQHTNVHVVTGAFADIERDADATVRLADGRNLRARLVVAADGAESAVRERLDIRPRSLDLRQQGIVAAVRTERPHQQIARQVFLPTGPLAFLPLPDSRACSIVWSVDDVRAHELLALDDAGFIAALATACGNRLGAVVSVSKRAAFPLALMHAERYVAERAVLIGDAAHTVHPLAGQGVNLGLLDAAALAEVLLDATRERRDIGARHVLRRYERWRRGENMGMIAVTGGFKYLFGNDSPPLAGLRSAGLAITNRLAPIKHAIMRRAAGLTGDLPRLARRETAVASAQVHD